MTIYRDGKAIELTSEGRLNAYYEQEHLFDLEDLQFVCEQQEIELTDGEKEVVLQRYRDNYENDYWFNTLVEYANEVVRETV